MCETLEDAPANWAALGLERREPARVDPRIPRTIADLISAACAKWPDREALVGRYGRRTYAQLAREIDAAAATLQAQGLRAGDRLAATCANHLELVVAFFAAARLGAVWVGVNRALAAPEKRYILEDSGARLYLADRAAAAQIGPLVASLPALDAVIDIEPGDPSSEWARRLAEHDGAAPTTVALDPYGPAAIAYTSGTTGFPKGVVHSQHNMILVGAMARLEGRGEGICRAGVALPLTILNLMILGPLQAFQAGRTSILMDRVDAAGLAEWIALERVESFSSAPAMIYDLLTDPGVDPAALASLTAPGVGGAAMPDAFRDLYRRKFARDVIGSYGLTEAPTSVTVTDPAAPFRPGASGVTHAHLRLAIQDPDGRSLAPGESGEICVGAAEAGPFAGLYTPMLGYWRRPEATAGALRDGWLHTGDVGRLDAEGNLYVVGRRNDVVIRGGANVYPAEVERVLQGDERVADCAVAGRADLRLGERVVAFVQLSAGALASEGVAEALLALCRDNLARYKVPEEIIFVEEMPRNAMNKIVKGTLKARHFMD